MIGIYKITSPSGRVYIGQSVNIKKRFQDYKNLHNVKTQIKLFRSFLKYGVDNHSFDVVCLCELDDLNELERYYQVKYKAITLGLNCLLTSTKTKKQVFSKEAVKRRCKKVLKGESHPNWGKKLTEETKRKIGDAQKGKFIPYDVRLKTSAALIGKPKPAGFSEVVKGLNNGNARKVVSENIITGEKLILNLKDTALFFNVNTELITTRISGETKKFRKLKEWIFYDYSE